MSAGYRVIVVSDIHYASEAEKARRNYELRAIRRGGQRLLVHLFRHLFWLKDPLAHNHLLERFLQAAGEGDLVVANGDYSCDSAFVGVGDAAAFASATEALAPLRSRFGERFVAGFGDHELGKMSLFGGVGGPRLASYARATEALGIETCWRRELGPWVLLGVVSSLVAFPVYEVEALVGERPEWHRLRERHLGEVRSAFAALERRQRVVLFCHDPTAIPLLWEQAGVRDRVEQVACTVIGHLHTPLVLRASRMLAGMPTVRFLGNAVRRMTTALREARRWLTFRVVLCPSLSGCQLLKDGGFGALELAADGASHAWRIHHLPW